MKSFVLLITLAVFAELSHGKIMDRCDFVKKMSKTFAKNRVQTWACIVDDLTGFDTAAVIEENGMRQFGIFGFVEGEECLVN